jgi:hypothetical protein
MLDTMDIVRLALIAVPLGCAACPTSKTCLPGGEPELTIGTGIMQYEALDPEDPAFLTVHGPQGGYHATIGLEAIYLDASDLMGAYMTGVIDGEELAVSSPWLQMRCNPHTETLQTWNLLLIWDAQPDFLAGKMAHIEVEVTDASMTTVSASVDARLYDPLVE